MAQITRLNGNVKPFAIDADSADRKIFEKTPTTDSDSLDDNVTTEFLTGWRAAVPTSKDFPKIQHFQAVWYTISALAAYIYQKGMPEWNTNQEMYHPCVVLGSDGVIYESVSGFDDSVDPTSDSGTNWKPLNSVNQTSYTATGTDTYVLTSSGYVATRSYTDAQIITFKVPSTNTGPSTVNLDGNGAKDLKQIDGTALVADDLKANDIVLAYFNSGSNRFEIIKVTGTGNLSSNQEELQATSTDKTFTVDTSGADYTTVGAALTDIHTKFYPVYKKEGITVTVNIETGYKFSEQVLLANGIDLSWITITSTDATVTIDRSALTTDFENLGTFPAFGAFNNCKLPKISVLFDMDASGTAANRDGVEIREYSSVIFGDGAGVKSAGGNGFSAYYNSNVSGGTNCDFSDAADHGVIVINSCLYSFDTGLTASNCGKRGFFSSASFGRITSATLNNAGSDGCRITGGSCRLDSSTIDNASGHGVHANKGAVVSARSVNATNAGSDAFRSNESSMINAFDSKGDGATGDFYGVYNNGIICARSTRNTGVTYSQTTNSLTASGYITTT